MVEWWAEYGSIMVILSRSLESTVWSVIVIHWTTDLVVARKNIRCLNFVALERSRKTSIGMRGTMRCWSIAGADGNALDGKYRTAKHLEVPEHLETEATTDLVSSSKIDVR